MAHNFDVPVNNSPAMQIFQSQEDLIDDVEYLVLLKRLSELPPFIDEVDKRAPLTIVHQDPNL